VAWLGAVRVAEVQAFGQYIPPSANASKFGVLTFPLADAPIASERHVSIVTRTIRLGGPAGTAFATLGELPQPEIVTAAIQARKAQRIIVIMAAAFAPGTIGANSARPVAENRRARRSLISTSSPAGMGSAMAGPANFPQLRRTHNPKIFIFLIAGSLEGR
jgi:hypothetical protein